MAFAGPKHTTLVPSNTQRLTNRLYDERCRKRLGS